ncbi:MAG: SAM-dependent methyltransferase [Bdellovibrionota bacterium]
MRPSYARPGFVTFKSPAEIDPAFDLQSIFARSYSCSLGKIVVTSSEDPVLLETQKKFANEYRAEIVGADSRLQPNQRVLSTFLAHQKPQELEYWFGFHVHDPIRHRPWVGGIPGHITMPPDAPSRAYVKMEEGLQWSNLPISPGDMALELGSSPGGASLALLNRGMRVVGVDPADMADQVMKHGLFTHLRKQSNQLTSADLAALGDRYWIFSDMNIDPHSALQSILHCHARAAALGGLLTVKLTEEAELADLKSIELKLRATGFEVVSIAQLYFNRAEVCVAFR